MVLNDLQDAGTAKTLEGLGVRVLPAGLGLEEGEAHRAPNLQWEAFQILLAGPDPEQWLRSFAVTHSMPNLAWHRKYVQATFRPEPGPCCTDSGGLPEGREKLEKWPNSCKISKT